MVLFLSGCSDGSGKKNDNNRDKKTIQTSAEKLVSSVWFVVEQDLIIQGIKVNYKTVSVNLKSGNLLSEEEWVVITTPSQVLTYSISDDDHDFKLNKQLTASQVEFVKNAESLEVPEIDLEIDENIERYDVYNRLQLSRCRSAKVWPELVDIYKGQNKFIYFSAVHGIKAPWALKWDPRLKKFMDFYKTSYDYPLDSGGFKGYALAITPNKNIRNQNKEILKDSLFVDFYSFVSKCDFRYGTEKKLDAVPDFLPRFDSNDDDFQSTYMVPETIEGLLLSTLNIYYLDPRYTSEDLDYSKSLKY